MPHPPFSSTDARFGRRALHLHLRGAEAPDMRSRSIILPLALTIAAFAGEALAWGPANHARITDATADRLGYTVVIHRRWAFVHYDSVDRTLTDIMKSGGVLAD